MNKTILLTGGTDGIGFEAAKLFVQAGHTLLLHGRSAAKLAAAKEALDSETGGGEVQIYRADLSRLAEVTAFADAIKQDHQHLDVVINNAGVFKMPDPITDDGYDARFIVNTVAPYQLTKALLPLLGPKGRVINLSSAAQAPVDITGFVEKRPLTDSSAYAQSKLAITMWSFHMAQEIGSDGPAIIAVNPASFLGSKMVKEAYGTSGHDLSIGADILFRTALGDEFEGVSGRYFDNDNGRFADPHPDALNPAKNRKLVETMDAVFDL